MNTPISIHVKWIQRAPIPRVDTIASVRMVTKPISTKTVKVSGIVLLLFLLEVCLWTISYGVFKMMVNKHVRKVFGDSVTAVLILTNAVTLILMIVKMEVHATITMVDIAASVLMALKRIQMEIVLKQVMKVYASAESV